MKAASISLALSSLLVLAIGCASKADAPAAPASTQTPSVTSPAPAAANPAAPAQETQTPPAKGRRNRPQAQQAPAAPADPLATAPGRMRNAALLNSIGIEWDLKGDTNHNATCSASFRKKGTEEWKQAMPLVRVDSDVHTKYASNDRPYNMFAGSIFCLDPGTTYEVKLDLADPDGGSTTQTVELTTWAVPHFPRGGKVWHVKPGNGGGSGTVEDPFLGIPAAHFAARPGDIVLIHAGNYNDVNIERRGEPGKPIVWTAAGDGDVIFQRLSVASYNWIDKIKFLRDLDPRSIASGTSYKHALNAPWDETRGVLVTRCTFYGYVYAITLEVDSDGWYIADNDITGHKGIEAAMAEDSWKTGEGVELRGSSNCVVEYNRICNVADGLSTPKHNCDINNNFIFDTSDDGIEADYGYANVRMWNNLISNVANYSLSFQPQLCGPWYFFRNQVDMPFKHFIVQKWFCVQNTMPERVIPRPNYEYPDKVVYINNRRLPKEAFATGAAASFITLSAGSPEINAGEAVVNINDWFVTDGKPDLGAVEFGAQPPHVGPRPADVLKKMYED